MCPPHLPSVLSPQELLSLAIDHERQEMDHYRRLAFCFLATDHGISPLMAALGIECERRLHDLRQAAHEHGLTASRGEAPEPPGTSLPLIREPHQALSALRQAEVRAERSARLAGQFRQRNATLTLGSLLRDLEAEKRAQRQILAERLAAQEQAVTQDTRLASHPWPRGWLAGARRLRARPTG